jgi:hypothetical protein
MAVVVEVVANAVADVVAAVARTVFPVVTAPNVVAQATVDMIMVNSTITGGCKHA